MASENLIVGSLISFQLKSVSARCYNGTVYFFRPEDGSFGIENVSRQKICGGYEALEENHQFTLRGIKNLRVIRLPGPTSESSTNTEKDDDEKSNPGPGNDAAESASTSSSK